MRVLADKIDMPRIQLDTEIKSRLSSVFDVLPSQGVECFLSMLDQSADVIAESAAINLEKPYGTNDIVALEPEYGISFLRMKPGQSTSFHKHAMRKEFFLVLKGELELRNGEEARRLGSGETANSTPTIPHSLSNPGVEDLWVLEIFIPGLLNDKSRLEDRYDRATGEVGYLQ